MISITGGRAMSMPDRNNPYNFEEYLQWRKTVNYYLDDPFFQ